MYRCFARWKEANGLCFRDQTILQFGDSWKLLASFVLLNPGSATPLKDKGLKNTFLEGEKLSFYVNKGDYYEFSVDPLMEQLIEKLYLNRYSGGVLKLYNLFNLKEPDSAEAKKQFKNNQCLSEMFTAEEDVKFGNAPVIIACGRDLPAGLMEMLSNYIRWAKPEQLYSLSKKRSALFSMEEGDGGNGTGRYHPSFAFKNGDVELGETCGKEGG